MRAKKEKKDARKKKGKYAPGTISIDYMRKTGNKASVVEFLTQVNRRGLKSLEEIKNHLAKSGEDELYANVVYGLLNAKTIGKKFYFKTDTFSKRLTFYLYQPIQNIKYITNDALYFIMLKQQFLESLDLQEREKDFLISTVVTNVTFTTDNFSFHEASAQGLIQDYDVNFSAICAPKIKENIAYTEEIIEKHENEGGFNISGEGYTYFGNNELCIIHKDGMSKEEILAKINNCRYLSTGLNGFKDGYKVIKVGENRIFFIYKKVDPESFCPSFVYIPQGVVGGLLFELALDYDELFAYLDIETPIFPNNICYWDTIQQFVDFLSIFIISAQNISNENRTRLSDWVDKYNTYKPFIVKLKKIQKDVEQMFHEFLNAFLNDSDYSRYFNLYDKTKNVYEAIIALKGNKDYPQVTSIFNEVPFCKMIQNQLATDSSAVLKDIVDVLGNIIRGSKAETLAADVRKIARIIFGFLPIGTDPDKVLFPFITPGGDLTGSLIEFNKPGFDALFDNLVKQSQKVAKAKQKKKNEIESSVGNLMSYDKKIDSLIETYFNLRPIKKKPLGGTDLDIIAKMLKYYVKSITNEEEKNKIFTALQSIETNKKYKDIPVFETMISDFFKVQASASSRKKNKKKINVSAPFYDTARDMGLDFYEKVTGPENEKMDIDSAAEDEKEET